LNKYVARRQKGMKHKTIKVHLPLHIADDILDFGVPSNVDASIGEKNHKKNIKEPAGTVRKCNATLTYDVALRYAEITMLHRLKLLAASQIPPADWHRNSSVSRPKTSGTHSMVSGAKFSLSRDRKTESVHCTWVHKDHDFRLPDLWCNFVFDNCSSLVPSEMVTCFTEHKCLDAATDGRASVIFRSHPMFQGKPWYDCAMVDWGKHHGELPVQIIMFIDLRVMKEDVFGGNVNPQPPSSLSQTCYIDEPGIYALVETFSPVSHSQDNDVSVPSGMIQRYQKNTSADSSAQLCIVSCECFTAPCVAIPDVGGLAGDHLFLANPRTEWATLWTNHIDDLHHDSSPESDDYEDSDDADNE